MTTIMKIFTVRSAVTKRTYPQRMPMRACFARVKARNQSSVNMGHLLTENRNGLIVDTEVTEASTSQEWDAGTTMLARQSARPGMTVGADKGYDTGEFVEGCRGLKVTPHVAA